MHDDPRRRTDPDDRSGARVRPATLRPEEIEALGDVAARRGGRRRLAPRKPRVTWLGWSFRFMTPSIASSLRRIGSAPLLGDAGTGLALVWEGQRLREA